MDATRRSTTAERTAVLRALHQLIDDPLGLDDSIVLRLLPPEQTARLRADPGLLDTPSARALRAFIAVRSRYAEDAIHAAVAAGVGQYVVLGAGLDTFAHRMPLPSGRLRVFEVDHPATMTRRYFRDRHDGLRPGGTTRLVRATVRRV